MSLQIWLPLNGNIENKGLSNISPTGTVYYADGGNLGKFLTGGVAQFQISSATTEFSVSFWARLSDNFSSNFIQIPIYVNDTTSNIFTWQHMRYTYNSISYDCIKVSTINPANDPQLIWLYDKRCTDSSRTGTWSIGEWTHFTFTLSRISSTQSLIRAYVNGVQVCDTTFAQKISLRNNAKISIGLNSSTATVKLQDFRIYDHCLSPREVHEISKGLILHYKLDSIGGRDGNPNIIKNTVSMQLNNSTSDVNTGVWRLAGTNTMTRSRVSIEDSPIGPCYCLQNAGQQTNTSDASCYAINSVPRVVGTTYTASFYARVVSGGPTAQVGFGFNSVTVIGGTSTKKWANYYMTEITTQWKRCTYTYTSTSSSANIYIGVGTDGVNTTTQICGFKIEEGSVATPWCPNSADPEYSALGYNSNVVSDCSGYGNDGTANNIVFSSDAVKYNGSSTFNGTNSYITVNNKAGKVTDEITVSCWAYSSNWSHNNRLLSCTEGGGWNFEAYSINSYKYDWLVYSSGAYRKASIGVVPSAGWHHFVGVWDGKTAKVYLDGVYKNASVSLADRTPITYANNYIQIGAESGGNTTTPASGSYFNGRISDVRIYGRAFTADEVKDLYETRASITDRGSMLTGEFDEVDTNTKIKHNFITQTNQFIEYHNPNNEYLFTNTSCNVLQSETFSTAYTPGTGTNSCGCTIGYWRISKPGIYWLEYDISFSGFTGVNSNGTFKMWTQGTSRNASTGVFEWSGINYFASSTTSHLIYGSKQSDVTAWAKAGGSYHVAFAVEFTQDMLNSVNGGGWGIRSDYSDGKGKVTISNPKIYEDKYKNRQGITKFYKNSDITSVEFVEI